MIKQRSGNQATVSNEIPVSVITESVSAYYKKLTDIFNNCIRSDPFPEILKKSEVAPVFKKGNPTSKTDYHPLSTMRVHKRPFIFQFKNEK